MFDSALPWMNQDSAVLHRIVLLNASSVKPNLNCDKNHHRLRLIRMKGGSMK